MKQTPSLSAFALLLVSLLPVALLAQPRRSAPPPSLVLTHLTVIDMTGAPAKPDMVVVITGDRITALGKTGTVNMPTGAQVVDATGKFLIPGLWDMHVHSGGYENGKKNLPRLIAQGVTGVRDMATPLEEILRLRREVSEGKILGPRMVIAGPLLQGPRPMQMPVFISVRDEAEASQTVIRLKGCGVDFIKIQDAVPRNIYLAIAREAKRQGLPFVGHVPPFISASEATEAKQRSIEHLGGRFNGVLLACSTRETELMEKIKSITNDALKALDEKREPDDSPIFRASFTKPLLDSFSEEKAARLIAAFRKNETWQVPTLVAQPIREAVGGGRKDLSEDDKSYGRMVVQKQLDVVGAMKQAGVKIMAGTDLPPESSSIHEELALLVEAGLTPLEALQTATRNPAEFLGRLGSLGTVERGKIADLVLLDANPLEEIGNTRRIAAVIVNGKLFAKESLQKMLGAGTAVDRDRTTVVELE